MLQGIVRAIRYATRRVRAIRYATRLPARSPLVTAPAILSVSGYRRETRQSSPRQNCFWLRRRPVWGNGGGVLRTVCRLTKPCTTFENV